MTNQEAAEMIRNDMKLRHDSLSGGYRKVLSMAISALQAQEVKQEVKKSGCTYKPDCPWYDGSKCNSPNDHGYHECDYDRGIFPESYEEEIKNSNESSLTQKELDTISRQAAIDAIVDWAESHHENPDGDDCIMIILDVPSAQPDGIPLEWIDKHLEWLDNCDNDFAQLAKVGIRAMVEIWKKDKT